MKKAITITKNAFIYLSSQKWLRKFQFIKTILVFIFEPCLEMFLHKDLPIALFVFNRAEVVQVNLIKILSLLI